MKHTLDDLLNIVYHYYPRGVGMVDGDIDINLIHASEEHARLVAARKKAATDERWPALRRRIEERFPEASLMNRSLHLPTGSHDACYSFSVQLPGASTHRTLCGLVSFLAPYHIVFSSDLIEHEIETSPRAFKVVIHGLPIHIPADSAGLQLLSNPDDESLKSITFTQREFAVTFEPSPDERPYAAWIASEIEATFGYERMPPEIGTVLVPDLATPRLPGEVRLYDCLFSDHHPWVKPLTLDTGPPALEIDANRLTDEGIALFTVLAAPIHIMRSVMRRRKRGGAVHVDVNTDRERYKKEMLALLAWILELITSPETALGALERSAFEATTRELEALVAAWDGEGPPPPAMVACAAKLLGNPDTSSEGS